MTDKTGTTPTAFDMRVQLNRAMARMARAGIDFTQELIDAEAAKIALTFAPPHHPQAVWNHGR